MADIYDKEKRSKLMSKISGKETKPEILVRRFLFANSLRFRKNDNRYPGKPDILLPKYNTAIFINGCFWHGHDCKAAALPKTKTQFWAEKIGANMERDKRNASDLTNQGWKVITIWECELKNQVSKENCLSNLLIEIKDRQI